MTNKPRVCSLDRAKDPAVYNAFVLVLVFAAVPAILTLSGCTGLTSAKSSTGGAQVLSASPSSIAFGDVSLGSSATQSLSIANTGSVTVSVSAMTISGTDITYVGGSSSILAGQTSTIQIQFAPQLPGDVTGSFSLSSNASNSPLLVSVKGSGKGPRLSISPTSPNFGNVTVGQSGTQSVQLTNSGNADLIVNLATVSGNGFGITGLSLPATISPAQSQSFTVQFAPTASGGVTGSISITDNSRGSPHTFAITGAGVAANATLSANPGSIGFGNVLVGSNSSQTITLANSGNTGITISQVSAVGNGFTATGISTPLTLAAGQNTTFTAKFAPAATGNAAGNVTVASNASNSTLSVALSGTGMTPPSITTQPASQTVTVGQTATFSATATGTATLTYQWNKNGTAISGATAASYTTPATAAADNGALFTVTVTNSAGNVTSNAATLTVNVPPAITTQSVSQTVTAGQTATFSVTATGTATLTYQWKKNGTAINGATAASYTTPATAAADNGALFTVTVTNSVGNVTSNAATLTVTAALVAPSITTQPASQTVTAGQTATFSATATGTATLTYQWKKNGTAISGATAASYTTPATAAADNGALFTVTVTNSVGNVTSNAGTLTVNAATFLLNASTTSLNFANVNLGSNIIMPVIFTNAGNSNVTVSGVSISGAGYTASGVSTGQILTPGKTATLKVTFTPAATGNLTGTATVTSNATNSPATIALTGVGMQGVPPAFPVWVSPSLVRVGMADAPGTISSINLSSARGETVDTQVIVQGPSGGLTNVNVSASALTGPGGATIPAASVTLYREYYLAVTGTASYGGGSNPPLGSGTYPEPLIPFNDPETGLALCGTAATLKACNATVSAGQNQPYWIDISVPRGATNSSSGTYTGSISITTDQGNATVPVTLTVWNFELPVQPSELSLWTLWPPAAGNTTTTLAQALMRNKIMGWYDVAANASSEVTNFGLNRSGLDSYYYIGIQCSGSYSSIPSTSQINAAAANFPVGLPLDFYLADELNGCSGDYTPLKTMGTNAHAANRSVKTMMTINTPDPNLFNEGDGRSAIDHWVLLDSVQQWPALPFTSGDLWSYTSCNAGFGNTPEWMVDYPPINERIQAGFLNWTQGATGILYYRSDGWTAGNALGSWNNVDTTACGGGLGRPGDGIFLYPPGPIASSESAPGIRLKAIRDGIQDYEYAQILKNLGQIPFVTSIVQPVATSWSNWSHDVNALEGARLQLGQLLNQLSPP